LLKFEESCAISGQLCFFVRKNGQIIEEYRENNAIMTLGRVAVARLFAGLPDGNGKFVGVGDSGEPPNPEQTGLSAQYLVEASKISFVNAQVENGITSWMASDTSTPNVRFDFTFGPQDANGLEIREFGLFCEDGTMFARRVRSSGKAIQKDDDLTIEGYWIVLF